MLLSHDIFPSSALICPFQAFLKHVELLLQLTLGVIAFCKASTLHWQRSRSSTKAESRCYNFGYINVEFAAQNIRLMTFEDRSPGEAKEKYNRHVLLAHACILKANFHFRQWHYCMHSQSVPYRFAR
jgi:hypothetical protein